MNTHLFTFHFGVSLAESVLAEAADRIVAAAGTREGAVFLHFGDGRISIGKTRTRREQRAAGECAVVAGRTRAFAVEIGRVAVESRTRRDDALLGRQRLGAAAESGPIFLVHFAVHIVASGAAVAVVVAVTEVPIRQLFIATVKMAVYSVLVDGHRIIKWALGDGGRIAWKFMTSEDDRSWRIQGRTARQEDLW